MASSPEALKRKAEAPIPKVVQFTSRNPPWTYLKLQLIPQPDGTSPQPIDSLSARTYLSSALSQFLGLTGTAIPIDILQIEHRAASGTKGSKYDGVWIRIPRDDAAAVVAALSSWISSGPINVAWRVCAKSNYLGALVAGSGNELFSP
ncbi:hypothetical protein N7495_001100 [Penicillium taxi]|uniref:uncharacterized protein n=1 Tax=Penicillium taxi TaxID=168475 RepID=UPI002544E80E|nr:uncharacterized protein N7495_001100 [Penicillium taxi]KAJ5908418.1 hypothetical protein N7495_001100 [Penicillium taxi]